MPGRAMLSRAGQGFGSFVETEKFGMKWRCESDDDCRMRIASRASSRWPQCAVCLVIRRCALCSWCAGEKNDVWRLRGSPSGVLRSAAPVGGRSGVWRYADLLGAGGAAGAVPPVWHGEAGRPGLAGRPSAFWVGRRCRVATIKDVAEETHLDWRTIKSLEMQYMRVQLRRVGTRPPALLASTRSRSARGTPTGS